jgi:hypothetical protein
MKCSTKNARRDSPLGFARGFGKTGRLVRAGIHLHSIVGGGAGDASYILFCARETTFHTQSNVVAIPALVKSALRIDLCHSCTSKTTLIASGESAGRLLWLQLICQLFAVSLLLIHREFS